MSKTMHLQCYPVNRKMARVYTALTTNYNQRANIARQLRKSAASRAYADECIDIMLEFAAVLEYRGEKGEQFSVELPPRVRRDKPRGIVEWEGM